METHRSRSRDDFRPLRLPPSSIDLPLPETARPPRPLRPLDLLAAPPAPATTSKAKGEPPRSRSRSPLLRRATRTRQPNPRPPPPKVRAGPNPQPPPPKRAAPPPPRGAAPAPSRDRRAQLEEQNAKRTADMTRQREALARQAAAPPPLPPPSRPPSGEEAPRPSGRNAVTTPSPPPTRRRRPFPYGPYFAGVQQLFTPRPRIPPLRGSVAKNAAAKGAELKPVATAGATAAGVAADALAGAADALAGAADALAGAATAGAATLEEEPGRRPLAVTSDPYLIVEPKEEAQAEQPLEEAQTEQPSEEAEAAPENPSQNSMVQFWIRFIFFFYQISFFVRAQLAFKLFLFVRA